jgi:hypothetical protein
LHKILYSVASILFVLFASLPAGAQQITGIWKGKSDRTRLELKIIKSGDSLTGVAYYSRGLTGYRRYAIKGYFDPETNDVIWWDDQILNGSPAEKEAGLHVADFNCPGEKEMRLDGSSSARDDKSVSRGEVHLQKVEATAHPDEWDWVINNYTRGGNDPRLIDSVTRRVAGAPFYPDEVKPPTAVPAISMPPVAKAAPAPVSAPASLTNQQKFETRQNKLQLVIPVTAPQVELRFYDNAAIDGDSIAIFLNGKMLREHILLGSEPQTIKIPAADLAADNELVLVAENLGSSPPNTSYLVAIVGHKKYEGRLFADEGSSALIRFIKEK